MKFNWGTGIFAFIVLFFLTAVTFIIWTLGLDFNLVEKDYYPKGLQYDSVKVKLNNTEKLNTRISISSSNDVIIVRFPEQLKKSKIQGHLWIYRPSDEKKDLQIPVQSDTAGIMIIPKTLLIKGKYILKFDYTANSTAYYQELEYYIP
ncbi:MAG: FixH family protein [Bacteroidales bacterium]